MIFGITEEKALMKSIHFPSTNRNEAVRITPPLSYEKPFVGQAVQMY